MITETDVCNALKTVRDQYRVSGSYSVPEKIDQILLTGVCIDLAEVLNAYATINDASQLPMGTVAVYTDSAGAVVASVTDFSPDGECAQKSRAQEALARAVVKAYCSSVVSDAYESDDCEQFLNKLLRKSGGKVTMVVIGGKNETT